MTVAIPTLNAGPSFARTLAAVALSAPQGRDLELLICDSGSSDETVALARSYGAEVIEIPPEQFSHGGTRNLLMSRSRGDHVAFLTQDAVPAGSDWLSSLVAAFALAPGVGLAFGPYRPQAGARLSVVRELASWFDSFSDGEPRIDALPPEAGMPHRATSWATWASSPTPMGAWPGRPGSEVPFREIAYAEDHLLAQDMLRAGYAKVYVPEAAVIHSHEYSPVQWLRRSFDEARAVREVYGFSLGGRGRRSRNVRGGVSGDRRWAREHGQRGSGPRGAGASLLHHGARAAGDVAGGPR